MLLLPRALPRPMPPAGIYPIVSAEALHNALSARALLGTDGTIEGPSGSALSSTIGAEHDNVLGTGRTVTRPLTEARRCVGDAQRQRLHAEPRSLLRESDDQLGGDAYPGGLVDLR